MGGGGLRRGVEQEWGGGARLGGEGAGGGAVLGAVLGGGGAEGGFEGAGEGAVVGEAAGEGDIGDAGGAGFEEGGSGLEAGLGDHLLGGEAEEALGDAGEAAWGEVGLGGEGGGGEGVVEVLLEPGDGLGDGGGDGGGFAGRADIAGDADEAGDDAVGGAEGEFGGEAPAALAVGVPMEFELVADGAAAAEDFGVLGVKAGGEVWGEDIAHGFTEEVAALAEAGAAEKGGVDRGVAAEGIFGKEGDFRELFEQLDHGLGAEGGQGGGVELCNFWHVGRQKRSRQRGNPGPL